MRFEPAWALLACAIVVERSAVLAASLLIAQSAVFSAFTLGLPPHVVAPAALRVSQNNSHGVNSQLTPREPLHPKARTSRPRAARSGCVMLRTSRCRMPSLALTRDQTISSPVNINGASCFDSAWSLRAFALVVERSPVLGAPLLIARSLEILRPSRSPFRATLWLPGFNRVVPAILEVYCSSLTRRGDQFRSCKACPQQSSQLLRMSRCRTPSSAFAEGQAISSPTWGVARFQPAWAVLPEGIAVEPSAGITKNDIATMAAWMLIANI